MLNLKQLVIVASDRFFAHIHVLCLCVSVWASSLSSQAPPRVMYRLDQVAGTGSLKNSGKPAAQESSRSTNLYISWCHPNPFLPPVLIAQSLCFGGRRFLAG